MQLGNATWPEIADLGSRHLLAFPLGSMEQHGPHLPLDTDTQIARALAQRLAAARADVVVASALPYGASGEHADFPGTLLIAHDLLAGVLVEMVRSARPSFRGVVFVSAHGGNAVALEMVRTQSTLEGDRVLVWSAPSLGGDAHAGRSETSIMLALNPRAVHIDRVEVGNVEPLSDLMDRLRKEGVRPISSNGVLGDPTEATEVHGRELIDAMAADLVAVVAKHWPEPGPAS